ncbi:MAG: hypothetical protein A2V66_09515 [Ignavibacteria bacterium RBG_13_36_8]|nr:MAG: hypothetical protein A2V66_09515 [Ignavibacteria bacterium RBG_13_36_8]
MIPQRAQAISVVKEKSECVITELKSSVVAFDKIKTEDIPNLLKVLSWSIPEERKIINNLCRLLRERKQLHLLIDM